jgi:hypothetical protein
MQDERSLKGEISRKRDQRGRTETVKRREIADGQSDPADDGSNSGKRPDWQEAWRE